MTEYQIPRQLLEASHNRVRSAEARLQADTEIALREIAFVLALTERVKHEILSERRDANSVCVG
jgi:hypothetical protein